MTTIYKSGKLPFLIELDPNYAVLRNEELDLIRHATEYEEQLFKALNLAEMELKSERESRREDHDKQQEVIRGFERELDLCIKTRLHNEKLLKKRISELEALVKEAHSFVKEKRKDTPGMGALISILSGGIKQ